jgi:hypothetical protein
VIFRSSQLAITEAARLLQRSIEFCGLTVVCPDDHALRRLFVDSSEQFAVRFELAN